MESVIKDLQAPDMQEVREMGVQPEPPKKSGISERLGLCTHLEPLEKNEELNMRDAGIAKNIQTCFIPLAYMQSLVKFLIAHHQPSIKLEQEQQKMNN